MENHAPRFLFGEQMREFCVVLNYLILGLTQTLFGKKADASDSVSETVKRDVAEARGPRRTDACCVSPIILVVGVFPINIVQCLCCCCFLKQRIQK